MTDAGISVKNTQDRHLTSKRLELIFCIENHNHSNMTYETFLETIPRLLGEKYPSIFQSSPGEAFSRLFENHLFPLFLKLEDGSKSDRKLIDNIDMDCEIIFTEVYPSFRDLYLSLFPWEVRKDITADFILNRSQRAFQLFVRDFDICPSLINKPQVTRIWNDLIIAHEGPIESALDMLPDHSAEVGSVFTLSKFMLTIYIIAVKGYEEDSNLGSTPSAEKLLVLLERLELSKGFTEVSSKLKKISLLPAPDVIHQVLYPDSDNIDEFSHISEEKNEESPEQDIGITVNANALAKLEEYLDKLQHIFQAYCSYGEPMNTTRMTGSKLVKMMRDCGVIRQARNESYMSGKNSNDGYLIKENVDIIFSIVCKKKENNGKLDFKQFLQTLELIAQKMFPEQNPDDSLVQIVTDFVLKLENTWNDERGVSSSNIRNQMEMLRNPEVIEILSIVHRSIIFYYRTYSNSQGLMDFQGFLKFCKDFSIFPDLIAKSKLLRFFCTLANIHSQTEQPEISLSQSTIFEKRNWNDSQSFIDEHLFVEGLALIAEEVLYKEPEPNTVERICFLMERMSQSDGPAVVLRKVGHNRNSCIESQDMLVHLRNKYPEIFEFTAATQKLAFSDVISELPKKIGN
jgi:hypothetical protein